MFGRDISSRERYWFTLTAEMNVHIAFQWSRSPLDKHCWTSQSAIKSVGPRNLARPSKPRSPANVLIVEVKSTEQPVIGRNTLSHMVT